MNTITLTAQFEIIVWDYDAAPDAAEYFSQNYTEEQQKESILPYYCTKRLSTRNFREAKELATYYVEEKCCTGAAVFQGDKKLFGIGLTFPHRKLYL